MTETRTLPGWVWVVTEKRGEDEKLYAFELECQTDRFIPVFKTQEQGVICQRGFKKQPGYEYDVEAMRLALVAEKAREFGMDIVFLDGEGTILERLTAAHDA